MQIIIVSVCLECVSKREIRKFEWIFRQFKEEIRRLSSAKSRIDDAEMAERRPKLRIKEFLRHTLIWKAKLRRQSACGVPIKSKSAFAALVHLVALAEKQ